MQRRQRADWKIYTIPVLTMGLTTLLYSNCQSEVDFNRDLKASSQVGQLGINPGAANGRGNGNIDEIQNNCQNSSLKQKTIRVNFPDPNRRCDWNAGLQPDPRNQGIFTSNEFFSGKVEQNVELSEIPAKAVVCDLEFNFDEQNFYYDDHFIFSFDDYVIATSYRMDSLLPTTSSGLLSYDWSYVSNAPWEQNKNQKICVGEDRGLASCQWPRTQTAGKIQIDYHPSIFHEIMAAPVIRSAKHNFQWVTIGDNDNVRPNGEPIDCRHSDISFDIQVSYYE